VEQENSCPLASSLVDGEAQTSAKKKNCVSWQSLVYSTSQLRYLDVPRGRKGILELLERWQRSKDRGWGFCGGADAVHTFDSRGFPHTYLFHDREINLAKTSGTALVI
jgi:hypothetical protein